MSNRLKYILISVFLIFLAKGCLKDMPETFPEELSWNPEVAFPIGETSLGMNEESGFDTLLLEINDSTGQPYWVELLKVPIEGESGFNFVNFFGTTDQINRLMIRVNAFNEFPAEVLLQAYFLDINEIILDSMFIDEPLVIPPGNVRENGEVISPSYAKKDVVFSGTRLEDLQEASSISFKILILNAEPDSTFIKYYPDYNIDIQLGAMVELMF